MALDERLREAQYLNNDYGENEHEENKRAG